MEGQGWGSRWNPKFRDKRQGLAGGMYFEIIYIRSGVGKLLLERARE